MKQKIALALVTMMGLALLGYTALRTLDLIQMTLPLDQQTIGYLALVAFDGGLVGWTLFFLHGAKGSWQRGIAAMMIVVSLAGVLIAFGADTLYQSGVRGTTAELDPAIVATAIWGMVLIIGANVGAVVATHLTDPEARKAMAEEEARDKIVEAALRQIDSNADSLAAELSPKIGEAWVTEMRAQFSHSLQGKKMIAGIRKSEREQAETYRYNIEEPEPVPELAEPAKSRNGSKAESTTPKE